MFSLALDATDAPRHGGIETNLSPSLKASSQIVQPTKLCPSECCVALSDAATLARTQRLRARRYRA